VPDDPLASSRPSARASGSEGDGITWAAFLALATIWGSSFMFIRVGLDEGVQVVTLVSVRTLSGALFLGVAILAVRGGLPGTREAWRHVIVLACLQIVFPFLLIAWGQQHIPTGIAAVLNALVPLYAVILASLVLLDEPITLNRLVGVLVGFGGVVLMALPSVTDAGDEGMLAILGMGAMALASLWYALAAVYARHRVTGRPLIRGRDGTMRAITALEISFAQIAIGTIVLTVLAIAFERPAGGLYALPPSPEAWFAVLWLGILSTGVGYVLFYRIIGAWGATRTTLVTYVLPIVAIVLGFVFLGERLVPLELAGSAFVLVGVVLVNASIGRRVLFARRASVDGPADVV
jgi:drug/metabolite transporter (DMT)-like permease